MKKLAAVALIMLGIGLLLGYNSFDWKNITTFGTQPISEGKTIASDDIEMIFVESKSMNVEIVRGSSEEINVRLDGKASKKYVDRFKMETEVKDKALYVRGEFESSFSFGLNIVDVDLVVELPERVWNTVQVTSRSGNTDVESLQTDHLTIELQSGNLDLDHIQAKTVSLETRSGNIEVEQFTVDQLSVKAQSGNIKLEDGTGRIHGETGSGNILLEADELLQDVELKARSGNVRIYVENEPDSANIQLLTRSGNHAVTWSTFEAIRDREEELSGKIGSGKLQINVETGSGNIKLGKK